MAAVPPDKGYLDYIDWDTLALLFSLMAVSKGLQGQGVFDALGAALLAGLATGVYGSLEETAAVWQRDLTFEPQMEGYHRAQLLAGWHKAVERSLHWAKD